MKKIYYKYYARPQSHYTYFGPFSYYADTEFIRVCEKRGSRFYTIEWWGKNKKNGYHKRKGKKYISGIKFIKNLSERKVKEELFISAL